MTFLFLDDIVTYGTLINRILKKTQIESSYYTWKFYEKIFKKTHKIANSRR